MTSSRRSLLAVGLAATALFGVAASRAVVDGDEGARVVGVASAAQLPWRGGSARPAAAADVPPHSFYFTRGIYSGGGGFRRSGWATDAPDADIWIINVLRRLTLVDAYPRENYVALDDPELRRFPFLYILEVSSMGLSEAEIEGLSNYVRAGGFVMVDDFWGSYEWSVWEREIRQVLPEYSIEEIPLDHPIFNTIYKVDEVVQVPNVGNAQIGITHEEDGYVPHVRGIFDEKGRLMVLINWNTDLGDAWEHAESPYYPVRYSTYAYQMAANFFLYAMTH